MSKSARHRRRAGGAAAAWRRRGDGRAASRAGSPASRGLERHTRRPPPRAAWSMGCRRGNTPGGRRAASCDRARRSRGTPVGRGQNARFPRTASDLTQQRRADLAASFQRCAIEALTRRAHAALEATPVKTLLGGGGVLCNTLLRTSLTALADRHGVALRIAPPAYCIDNAAMIAGLGHLSIAAGHIDGTNLQAKARLSIEDATA